jgi:hypothetical protein
MDKVTAKIHVHGEEEPIEVELSPLTVICKGPDIPDITVEGAMEITSDDTVYHAERVNKLDPRFPEVWERLEQGINSHRTTYKVPEPNPTAIRAAGGKQWLHLMGMIDLCLKFIGMGITPHVVYPETYLHPSQCAALGDVFLYLQEYAQEEKERPQAMQTKFVTEE